MPLISMKSKRDETNLPSAQCIEGSQKNLYEFSTLPFVIKIWLEETVEESGRTTWRGYITHVPSGRQRPIKELDDIKAFIVPYLKALGMEFGMLWRARRWLNCWKPHLKSRR